LLLGRYTGAFNEVMADILWNPLFPDMQARVLESFRFPTRQVRKMRIVQTANMGPVSWNIAEVRLYQAGQELPRASAWRLTAHPNPWDVQMAFDASPVTRWRTWQGGEPGMYIEVDLGADHPLDAVTVLTSQDCRNARLSLEVNEGDGRWITVPATPVESTVLEDLNLRKLATEEVKRRGVEYLVVKDSDIGGKDFREYAPQWGLQELKLAGDLRLYKIR
jgi:hypothetical protein